MISFLHRLFYLFTRPQCIIRIMGVNFVLTIWLFYAQNPITIDFHFMYHQRLQFQLKYPFMFWGKKCHLHQIYWSCYFFGQTTPIKHTFTTDLSICVLNKMINFCSGRINAVNIFALNVYHSYYVPGFFILQ